VLSLMTALGQAVEQDIGLRALTNGYWERLQKFLTAEVRLEKFELDFKRIGALFYQTYSKLPIGSYWADFLLPRGLFHGGHKIARQRRPLHRLTRWNSPPNSSG